MPDFTALIRALLLAALAGLLGLAGPLQAREAQYLRDVVLADLPAETATE